MAEYIINGTILTIMPLDYIATPCMPVCFYYCDQFKKENITRFIRKRKAYDKLARNERNFVGGKLQVMFISIAGTGVGTKNRWTP